MFLNGDAEAKNHVKVTTDPGLFLERASRFWEETVYPEAGEGQ